MNVLKGSAEHKVLICIFIKRINMGDKTQPLTIFLFQLKLAQTLKILFEMQMFFLWT